MRIFLSVTLLTLAACAAFGQTTAPPPHFEAADVHPSRITAVQVARGPFMTGARYDLRNATVVDLVVQGIRAA